MSEWFKEHDWKSCVGLKPTGGSNPLLCAKKRQNISIFCLFLYLIGWQGNEGKVYLADDKRPYLTDLSIFTLIVLIGRILKRDIFTAIFLKSCFFWGGGFYLGLHICCAQTPPFEAKQIFISSKRRNGSNRAELLSTGY